MVKEEMKEQREENVAVMFTSSVDKQNNRAPRSGLERGAVEGIACGGAVLVRELDHTHHGAPVVRHAEVGNGCIVPPPDLLWPDHPHAVLLDHKPTRHTAEGHCCQDHGHSQPSPEPRHGFSVESGEGEEFSKNEECWCEAVG